MKTKKFFALVIFILLTGFFGNYSSVQAASGVSYPTDTGLPENSNGIAGILSSLLKWLLSIVGLIAILSFVISGLQYFFAAGDDTSMKTAKKTMMFSIIGVLVALSGAVAIQAIESLLKGNTTF